MKSKLTFIFILLTICQLTAQDRQFWEQAFGGRTALLGGIAVGGVRDYSATFYNPGALGFVSKKSMNVNFNMYGVKDFSFIDGGGPDIDSRYTRVSLYPASLAGPLPFLGDSLNRFSYMIYANGYSYVRVSERYEGYKDVIPTRPPTQPGFANGFEGDEYLINQGKIDVLLSEVTVGFGYAKKISDNVGIGVTLLSAYRDQTKQRYESYAAFDTTNQRSATSDLFVDIDFWAAPAPATAAGLAICGRTSGCPFSLRGFFTGSGISTALAGTAAVRNARRNSGAILMRPVIPVDDTNGPTAIFCGSN